MELIFGVEPFHVLLAAITIGGSIIAFQFKINRCIGRLESNVKSVQAQLNTITDSYLDHLDKPK